MTGVGVRHARHLIHLDGQTGGGVGRQVDTKLIRPRDRTEKSFSIFEGKGEYFLILKASGNFF